MELGQGVAPSWELLAGVPSWVLPFGEFGRAGQRLQHELADIAGGETRGGRIHRLNVGNVSGAFGRHHIVGVCDLEGEAEALDLAGDYAFGTDRMLGEKLVGVAAEEHQIDRARAVIGLDPPGLLRAARLVMGVDLYQEGLGVALDGFDHGGHGAADKAVRLEE